MRSTSGITCCHFFCSVVFSMPVCRKPIVGATESTVSPSSSRTRRSTPCVLGCWGPMLTVITSVLISGIRLASSLSHLFLGVPGVHCGDSALAQRSLHQIAHHMQQRPVHFLHPRRRRRRHVDVNRRR